MTLAEGDADGAATPELTTGGTEAAGLACCGATEVVAAALELTCSGEAEVIATPAVEACVVEMPAAVELVTATGDSLASETVVEA